MKDDVAQERDDGDESDETEQETETAIQSRRDGESQGRLISEGGVINSIIITRFSLCMLVFIGHREN